VVINKFSYNCLELWSRKEFCENVLNLTEAVITRKGVIVTVK